MSLRPAQELVQESSKFSLRQFFESQTPQAIRSPAELPTEGFPTLNATSDAASALHPQHSPPAVFATAPHLRPQTPPTGASPSPIAFFVFDNRPFYMLKNSVTSSLANIKRSIFKWIK